MGLGTGAIWVVVKIMVPFWGPLNSGCRNMLRTQEGTIILTATHMGVAKKQGS